MRTSLVAAAAIFFGSAGVADQSRMPDLTVTGFSRAPNYLYCTDREDKSQLTDGRLSEYPIWVEKGTVGWSETTPIAIEVSFGDEAATRSPRAGTLRIHTAVGTYAGVNIPRQVDVYARGPNRRLVLVGSLSPNTSDESGNRGVWLEVPVSAATEALILVLHASGAFLFLDEIAWQPSASRRMPVSATRTYETLDAITDSSERLNELLLNRADMAVRAAQPQARGSSLTAWVEDPWAEINPVRSISQIARARRVIDIVGFAGERESVCIGIAGGHNALDGGLSVTLDGVPDESVRLSVVRPVVAANGKLVFDALEPIDGRIRKPARFADPVYLWLDFDLGILGPGLHQFSIRVTGSGNAVSLPGTARVTPSLPKRSKALRAVNWAYLSDTPVFHEMEVASRDLLDHGINVFVVHPTDIPGLALDNSWRLTHGAPFDRTVELAKEGGTLLLYLGWTVESNPLGFTSSDQSLSPDSIRRLNEWAGRMAEVLAGMGLPENRWALYPIDEPSGSSLKFLALIAEEVKRRHPLIRIYANPSSSQKRPISVSDLTRLRELVDYWQPNKAAVDGSLAKFFRDLKKGWWIYANPSSPAKSASPLKDYRLLSWSAWQLGASGVGFWSYSDTGGSSAWNDVDGRRPDWAVVYESNGRLISSRRWEAFREGLEDYRLLTAFSNEDIERALIGVAPELALEAWKSSDVQAVRRALLSSSVTR